MQKLLHVHVPSHTADANVYEIFSTQYTYCALCVCTPFLRSPALLGTHVNVQMTVQLVFLG